MKSPKSAFTLIEIIVIMTIMLLMTGVVTANYVSNAEERKLRETAYKIRSAIMIARTRAVNGDTGEYNCEPFVGVETFFTNGINGGDNSYEIRLCCSNTETCQEETSNLSHRLVYEPITGNTVFTGDTSVRFFSYEARTNINTDESAGRIIPIKNEAVNKCMQVRVSPIGGVVIDPMYDC